MAEVGLVSGIIALAGVGAKLAMQIYQIADVIGSAGKEARVIAAEVSIFAQSLTAVSKLLERPVSQTTKVLEIAEILIASCRPTLDDLADMVDELQPSVRQRKKTSAVRSLMVRTRWLLKRPKVEFLRSTIASFKATLTLLFAAIDLGEATERGAPEEIREPLQMQVCSLVQTVADAKETLNEAHVKMLTASEDKGDPGAENPIADAAGATEELLLIDFSDDVTEVANDQESTVCTELVPVATQLSVEASHVDTACQDMVLVLARQSLQLAKPHKPWSWQSAEGMFQAPPSPPLTTRTAPSMYPDQLSDAATGSQVSEVDVLETETAQQPELNEPQAEAVDDLSQAETTELKIKELEDQLQRLMKLRESSTPATSPDWKQQATADRLRNLEQMLQAMKPEPDSSKDTSTDWMYDDRLQKAEDDLERMRQAMPQSPRRRPSFYDAQPSRTATLRRRPSVHEAQPPQAATPRRARSTHRAQSLVGASPQTMSGPDATDAMEQSMRQVLLRMLDQARTEGLQDADDERADRLKAPLRFKDCVGRKFRFPWRLVKTWKGMEGLIKQAFLHVDVVGEHVQAGHYDLAGPDGEIILPQVWEAMVQPDWEVTMHMWPLPDQDEGKTKEIKPAATVPADPFAALNLGDLGLAEPKKGKKSGRTTKKDRLGDDAVEANAPPEDPWASLGLDDLGNVKPQKKRKKEELAANASSSMKAKKEDLTWDNFLASGLSPTPVSSVPDLGGPTGSKSSKEVNGFAAWLAGGDVPRPSKKR